MNTPRGGAVPHILHLHSTFAPGGKELRTVQLINAFGKKARHTIVSAEPERLGAAERIARTIDVRLQPEFPSLKGRPTPGRLQKLAKAMRGFDLVCTYNWGAMDAVMAHTLFKDLHNLPPLIHHEDGFDESELKKLKTSRTWYRRIALGKSAGLVVPSERLEEIGFRIAAYPLTLLSSAARAMEDALAALAGKSAPAPRLSFADLRALVGFPEYQAALDEYEDSLEHYQHLKTRPAQLTGARLAKR